MLKKKKPQKKLKVFDEKERMVNSEVRKANIITKLFKETLEKPDQGEIKYYPPWENLPPFTEIEIQTAV